jgi:hypothetical protein
VEKQPRAAEKTTDPELLVFAVSASLFHVITGAAAISGYLFDRPFVSCAVALLSMFVTAPIARKYFNRKR